MARLRRAVDGSAARRAYSDDEAEAASSARAIVLVLSAKFSCSHAEVGWLPSGSIVADALPCG